MPGSTGGVLKEELIESNDEYRRLHEEHQAYERRLENLYQKSNLSQDDEIEQKRIKLHKLALKDQMQQILSLSVAVGAAP